jgi:hypothetical protein
VALGVVDPLQSISSCGQENGKLNALCLLPLAGTRNCQLFASSIQLLEVGDKLGMLLNMDKGSLHLLPQWNGHWDGVGWHGLTIPPPCRDKVCLSTALLSTTTFYAARPKRIQNECSCSTDMKPLHNLLQFMLNFVSIFTIAKNKCIWGKCILMPRRLVLELNCVQTKMESSI